MEKYTTGTRPLRRRSGCKEEENPYMRRVRTRLQTRHFVASSIRKEGRVAPFLESRRNKQSRPIRLIPLPPSLQPVVVATLSFMTSTVYRAESRLPMMAKALRV